MRLVSFSAAPAWLEGMGSRLAPRGVLALSPWEEVPKSRGRAASKARWESVAGFAVGVVADMGDLPMGADRPRAGRSVVWTVPGGTTSGA